MLTNADNVTVASIAMVDLGEAPSTSADRRRALAVAVVLVLGMLLIIPEISRPLGASYPVFAIVMALSIAAIAITSLLLWAQSRVTRSFPLTVHSRWVTNSPRS